MDFIKRKARILLLSPYDAMSHGLWRRGLADFLTATGRFDVIESVLPPRYFSWRTRGNALTYAMQTELQVDFDLIIATSMTDLSALRGMNRHLAQVPAMLYFHENQFFYPDQQGQGIVERQITSIYAALSAERLFFNSAYNRDSFLAGAENLLKKMPDHVPAGIKNALEARARVNPVALGVVPIEHIAQQPDLPLSIVWNHRWEHDKAPERLLEIVVKLTERDFPFSLSLFGQRFKQRPQAFQEIITELTTHGRAGQIAFIPDRAAYLAALGSHHVVLSTASHEFQGLAVLEAIQMGCIPVTPDALCYPEYVPEALRYQDVNQAVDLLMTLKPTSQTPIQTPLTNSGRAALLSPFSWDVIGPRWMAAINDLLGEEEGSSRDNNP
ncbi:MAG: glycosyltransferase involved in cell wall biosynthesis [Candidatus Azotimanducaceae bacterium]|jgi:glycosyltransferase involved in cell wall biosynthesis